MSHDANDTADHTRALVDDAVPFLDAQAQTMDATRRWAHNLAGVTDQLVTDDSQFRRVLQAGPGFAQEVSRLLNQVKPTLPVLLANLTTIGQIGVTYHPSLEQLLVLLPPSVAAYGSYGVVNNPTGLAVGGFTLTIADPPACTVGFLPPVAVAVAGRCDRDDTPDNLYCKLPQDSPIAVRGVRNNPCMGHPGKRAPTVEICNSDKPYEPLAMRQHMLGPYPLDPNLLSQGVPPDDRVGIENRLFGPVDGTPLPPGATPAGTPPGPPTPGSLNQPPTAPIGGPQAAPTRLHPTVLGQARRSRPFAMTRQPVGTSRPMVRCSGRLDLARSSKPTTWKDMLVTTAARCPAVTCLNPICHICFWPRLVRCLSTYERHPLRNRPICRAEVDKNANTFPPVVGVTDGAVGAPRPRVHFLTTRGVGAGHRRVVQAQPGQRNRCDGEVVPLQRI